MNILNLLYLRFLNLIFNLVIFNSLYLSGLGNIFGSFLGNIFGFLNGNVFNSFNGDLFLDSVDYGSWDVFFLVFDSLIIGNNFFLRNGFYDFSCLRNCNFFLNCDSVNYGSFDFIVFYVFSFVRVIFDSRISFDGLFRGTYLLNYLLLYG